MQRLLIGCVVAALAALAIWHPAPRPPQVAPAGLPPTSRQAHTAARGTAAPIVVYVAGSVAHPGLYRLRAGSRVADAVGLAGGLLHSADTLAVNLAARLNDGDEVAVAALGDAKPARSARRRSMRSKGKNAPSAPANVNTSSDDQLAHVPGIGPTIARRIVELREQDGPFTSLDELLDVAGMSPARLDRAQPYLIL